ncbi:response regulator transcription factor [Clostridium sp. 19966]|uniref:response regulator transcription factor n=1 Tax=Clostridium sp. 19966 TaxID=2768166 RepID=UPI0028DF777A|nr:response regulator transcription factor [Clostridium sp. 19966]MDT8719339.1 response regulator transcription factor [Clostridium sp. 19966]
MANTLLLVEDDESLALGVEFTLKDEGYEVLVAPTLGDGRKAFKESHIDLVILDVNLPDGSGYELCKEIRKTSDVPIMFLTALDEEVNIVLGLEIGGDDYITKPFRVRELLSRVKVLLRRASKNVINKTRLRSGNIIVDTSSALVSKDGKEIVLTAQEYKLLLIFINNPEIIMKKDKILEKLIEGEEVFFDENTLAVYINRIREKIEDTSKNPQYIITQRGMGYKWNKEVLPL